jgi:hypothetical protein
MLSLHLACYAVFGTLPCNDGAALTMPMLTCFSVHHPTTKVKSRVSRAEARTEGLPGPLSRERPVALNRKIRHYVANTTDVAWIC